MISTGENGGKLFPVTLSPAQVYGLDSNKPSL